MTTRSIPNALLSAFATVVTVGVIVGVMVGSVAGCSETTPTEEDRAPYVDDWRTEAELPADQFTYLSIGDRETSDNFANRGDVEVRYVDGANSIKIEMQRFTVANSPDDVDETFGRMQYWGYNKSSPEKPSDKIAPDLCTANADISSCYIRAYYDGQLQPVRDGANFRITVPAGWDGDIDITTSDNLEEGIDIYPDRGDVIVDGLNGNLSVDLDSGNVEVRVDPNILHYASCSAEANMTCEDMDYAMGCGCSEPTNIDIKNGNAQASNITVDVGNADNWYTMILENRGMFSSSDDFVCNATIDCDSFADCNIDSAYANIAYQERAEVNYPGMPAVEGTGIRIELISESCGNIKYVDGIEDYGLEDLPEEKRGELRVCVGCL